jgi:hypothetical protein
MAADFIAGRIAVENKTCFNPAPATDEFGSIAGELGSKGSGAAGVASTVPAAWSSACDNLSTTLSVTQSQVKVIELDAKSQGREPTDEELDEACGPLSFLTKLPGLLDEALSDIFGKFNEFATSFSETVGEFMAKFDELVADVVNAVDEIAQAAAQLVLDAFELANQAALAAIEVIESTINTVATAINDAINFATDAFNKAIDKLLAFADSINFASIFGLDCQTEALENAVDTDKIADADEINRVIAPEVVVSTDETITSETLSKEPFNLSAAGAPGASPELEELIDRYRTAARALSAGRVRIPIINRTERTALEKASRDAFQDLRVGALAEGKNVSDLPVWGENFDEPLPPVSVPRGIDAANPNSTPTGGDSKQQLEQEIAEIRKEIEQYNRLNDEQFSLIVDQNLNLSKYTPAEVRAADQLRRDVRRLRGNIESRINRSPNKDVIRRAVGSIRSVKEGVFGFFG